MVHGGRQTPVPGAGEHLPRCDSGQWRFSQKKVVLLASDLPLIQLPVL
jgi:hypothetical protein